MMNVKQKTCLWVGIAVFVLMGLFPPCTCYFFSWNGVSVEEGTAYRFLVSSENVVTRRYYHIDMRLLGVQWVLVGAVTTGLVVTLRTQPSKEIT
jgi:predicted nucleic acid-binding Zn finger protein